MPKSSNQKLKLLYLRRILLEETDDNHHLNAEQLVSKLEQLGINADRKTIYADVAALQDYGMDIFLQRRSRAAATAFPHASSNSPSSSCS